MVEYKDALLRGVAQLVEHTAGGRVVARSTRVAPTRWKKSLLKNKVLFNLFGEKA